MGELSPTHLFVQPIKLLRLLGGSHWTGSYFPPIRSSANCVIVELFMNYFCMSPCSSDYIIAFASGARGLIIVGTHSLVVRGSTKLIPLVASYGIFSNKRVSPFNPIQLFHLVTRNLSKIEGHTFYHRILIHTESAWVQRNHITISVGTPVDILCIAVCYSPFGGVNHFC